MRILVSCCVVLLWMSPALEARELKPATVFSDHMVLQREKPVPIWGRGDPGEVVTVHFAGQTKTATTTPDGKWQVHLDPLMASAAPQTLTIQSNSQSGRRREVTDVLVGEVWLGSGQSNMAMAVNRAQNFDTEQAAANLPLIRMFREESGATPTLNPDAAGKWTVCSPDTVGTFSATLFFFGREVNRELGVPVGLINSSVGGTPIESWIAEDVQASVPELQAAVAAAHKGDAEFDEARAKADYAKALDRWQQQVARAKAAGGPPPRRPRDPVEQRARRGGLGDLFNGKIHPLIPFALRGLLWYQGEANAQPGKGELYQHQLPLLVQDWRARWGEELPFAWVQLPNFERTGDGWMLVREAMLKSLQLPQTGMAITLDIGEPRDIHPRNKQEVGRRLALWALGTVYRRDVRATSGPLLANQRVQGSEVVLTFDHATGGLKASTDFLRGFEIASEDRQWKPASARIQGNTVIVTTPDVTRPVAVRYAWAANPEASLFNAAGLPASPFRTAEWP